MSIYDNPGYKRAHLWPIEIHVQKNVKATIRPITEGPGIGWTAHSHDDFGALGGVLVVPDLEGDVLAFNVYVTHDGVFDLSTPDARVEPT